MFLFPHKIPFSRLWHMFFNPHKGLVEKLATRASGENGGETVTFQLAAAPPVQVQRWHRAKPGQKLGRPFPSAAMALLMEVLSEVLQKRGSLAETKVSVLLDSAWVPASLSCTAGAIAKAGNKVLYANISNEKLEIPEISLCWTVFREFQHSFSDQKV